VTVEFNEANTESGAPIHIDRKLRRNIIVIVISVLAFAIITPLILWVNYRYGTVVTHNAWIRGHITYMGSPREGVVSEVLVHDGDHVKAGEVLARLSDRQLQARLLSAQAELEKANRELEVEKLAIKQERRHLKSQIAEASAQVKARKARADDASEHYKALASLEESGASSREDIRQAEALLNTTAAEWEAAKAVHRSVLIQYEGLSVREAGIAMFESRVATARADVAQRQAELEETKIVAPEEGRVVRRLAEPGTSLEVGDPVVSVWIGHKLWVEAWVDEDSLSDVKVGNMATVKVKSFPDRVFHGEVEAVGMAPDFAVPESDVPQPFHSRMRNAPVFLVRIGLIDPGDRLLPGLSAEVGIKIDEALPADLKPPVAMPHELKSQVSMPGESQ
jgi:multidrug resistance efflux pump